VYKRQLIDVTAHSLGVKTIDSVDSETGEADHFSAIIRRNTRIPTRKAEVYYSVFDRQPGIDVQVYQGESLSCMENSPVGNFYFKLNPRPAGSVVTTEFAYDKEGIVHITVEQKGCDNRKEVTLDVRKKKITEKAAGEPRREESREHQRLLNYIIEKAGRLMENKSLPDDLAAELSECAGAYETALREDGEEDNIDRLEEKLLDVMEKAEERCGDGE